MDTPQLSETIQRLHRFGYIPDLAMTEWKQGVPGFKKVLEQAITDFQGFNGLEQTGELNEDTLVFVHRPRCGAPDMIMTEEATCKWPDSMKDKNGITQIRVRHNIYGLNPLAAEQEQAAFQEAIASWNAVCGINLFLEEVNHPHISSTIGVLGSGTLAISYLPCGASPNDTMDQTYNRAVNWSYKLLVQVIAHEVGHAIGLGHGPSGSLLQPTASGTITKPQPWDIQQVVSRYGPPRPISPPTSTGDGQATVGNNQKIRLMAQEAGTFKVNVVAESTKIIVPSDNHTEVTFTKPGAYDFLLIPKVSNVHI